MSIEDYEDDEYYDEELDDDVLKAHVDDVVSQYLKKIGRYAPYT